MSDSELQSGSATPVNDQPALPTTEETVERAARVAQRRVTFGPGVRQADGGRPPTRRRRHPLDANPSLLSNPTMPNARELKLAKALTFVAEGRESKHLDPVLTLLDELVQPASVSPQNRYVTSPRRPH